MTTLVDSEADTRFSWNHILYRFFDSDGDLLYVGLTNNIHGRFSSHAGKQPWWAEVADCRVEFLPSRDALREAEVVAIRAEKPRYNVIHNRASEPERLSESSRETDVQLLPIPYVSVDSPPPRPDAVLADDCWGVYWRLPDGRTINPQTGEPFFELSS